VAATANGDRARNRVWWIVGGVVLLGLMVLYAMVVPGWVGDRLVDDHLAMWEPPTAAELDLPPSERGKGGREVAPGAGRESEPHEELRCAFVGEANLDPGLGGHEFGGSRQEMTLAPGARFSCDQNGEATAGSVELRAVFGDLDLVAGVARGEGTITWEELPRDRAAGHGPAPLSSTTDNEIELRFPVIVVWLTITDGPYEGHRGKLVLQDWELIQDGAGAIVGVRFRPTDFHMSTL